MGKAPHRLEWEQLDLLPRPLLTAELSMHFDGPRGRLGFGYRIRDTSTDECIAMGTLRETLLRDDAGASAQIVEWLCQLTRSHLGAF